MGEELYLEAMKEYKVKCLNELSNIDYRGERCANYYIHVHKKMMKERETLRLAKEKVGKFLEALCICQRVQRWIDSSSYINWCSYLRL